MHRKLGGKWGSASQARLAGPAHSSAIFPYELKLESKPQARSVGPWLLLQL
jgi:hypothetical protein